MGRDKRMWARRAVVAGVVACAAGGSAVVQAAASGTGRPQIPAPPLKAAQAKLQGIKHLEAAGSTKASADVATGGSAHVAVTTVFCGELFNHPNTTVTLQSDLTCLTGDGLDVTANKVIINLNGHEIGGPGGTLNGATEAIALESSDDTVKNGTLAGFDLGIWVPGPAGAVPTTAHTAADPGSTATITGVYSEFNGIGIELEGSGDTLSGDVFDGNQFGILSDAGGAFTIKDNAIMDNAQFGILLEDQGGDNVTGNTAGNNGVDGITTITNVVRDTLTSNSADDNADLGINEDEGAQIDGGHNEAHGNGNDGPGGVTPTEQCSFVACSSSS